MSDLRQTWANFIARRVSPHFAGALGGHRRFLKDTSGSVLVYVGLTSFVFLGFAGLAVDVGHWYASKRTMQSAADAAAMGGAFAVKKGSADATIVSMAKSDAALNGYEAIKGALVTINNPPSSGPYAGNIGAVEAIVQQPVPGFFSQLILDGPTNVAARAVAMAIESPTCVHVLDPSAAGALSIVGTADAVLNCGVNVNSDSPSAISSEGTSCLKATNISVTGGVNVSGSKGCLAPNPYTGAAETPDPLADLNPPLYPVCDPDEDPFEVTADGTISAGVYCGGIHIHGNAVVDFDAGEYVLSGVGLQIEGNTVVTGDEVTFYLDSETVGVTEKGKKSAPRSIYIAGTTDVTLSAPTSGDYEGILFYQDPGSDPNLENVLTGTSDMSLTGTLYFPNNHLRYAGNTESGGAAWTNIVTRTLEFVGTSFLGLDPGPMASKFALKIPTLVE